MPMQVSTDADEVRRLAVVATVADPVLHTVFGSIAASMSLPHLAPCAVHPADDDLPLVIRGLPQLPVQFSVGWSDGLDEVAAAIAALDPPAAALSGPVETVEAVAARLGRPVALRSGERLFRLDELIEPAPIVGGARLADESDHELLLGWFHDFGLEAFDRADPELESFARDRIVNSRCWMWLDGHGRPCAMAIRQLEAFGAARVGPVFTPRELRGRGYGTAVTAAATRDILDAGAVACLFTQLSNPTSNKIYQAIGYVAVMDRATLHFD